LGFNIVSAEAGYREFFGVEFYNENYETGAYIQIAYNLLAWERFGFKLFIKSGSLAHFNNPAIGLVFCFWSDNGSFFKSILSFCKFNNDKSLPFNEYTIGMNGRSLLND
jgi:hypothetical protein